MKISPIFFLFISALSFGQVAETPEDISPLLIGEKVPQVAILSVGNERIPLRQIVSEKPTVLLFYRGGWCPFCNVHLAAVGEIDHAISALGFQIIAISPDSPEKLKESLEEQDLNYRLFSDADGALTKAMGLAFRSPEKYDSMLRDRSGGANDSFLPVPALFVVNTEGIIEFEYISPNYEQRIQTSLLLDILKHYSKKD